MSNTEIVQKRWNLCDGLRDDGILMQMQLRKNLYITSAIRAQIECAD